MFSRSVLIAVFVAIAMCLAMQVMASVPVVHPTVKVYQADPVSKYLPSGITPPGLFKRIPAVAVPGFFDITPGGDAWRNYVGAAKAGVPYTIKSVVLTKETPKTVQCSEVFQRVKIIQEGTPNIRLHWPLMYEIPGTTWTLTILYGTPIAWDDDGLGPNPPSYVHTDVWVWQVDAKISDLKTLLRLFHDVPFGLDEVPLISDEALYPALQDLLSKASAALSSGDVLKAQLLLLDFELEVMDACIEVSPAFPNPTGPGTGIAQTAENPACCKILVDVEYILYQINPER